MARLVVIALVAFVLTPGVAQAKGCPGPIVGDTDGVLCQCSPLELIVVHI